MTRPRTRRFRIDHAWRSQSRYARPFSEEAATPGLPATLTRFGNRFSNLLGPLTCEPFGSPGAGSVRLLQNHLHDHWQRNLHACSDGTFSHFVPGINGKSRARCANPVDDGSSLWKGTEKAEEIELKQDLEFTFMRQEIHLC